MNKHPDLRKIKKVLNLGQLKVCRNAPHVKRVKVNN